MPILLRRMAAGTDGMGAALSEPGGGRNMVVGGGAADDELALTAAWLLTAAPSSLSEEA